MSSEVFIRVRIGLRTIYLIVAPGDNISFKYFDNPDKYKSLKFEGTNAAGQYWYNVYNFQPLDNYNHHGSLLLALATESKDQGLKKIGKFIFEQTQPLDSLYKLKQISPQFFLLAKTDIRDMHALNLIKGITTLQEKNKNSQLNDKYQRIKDALFCFAGPAKITNTQTYFGAMFLGYYYESKLEESNTNKSNSYKLGPYSGYQMAPAAIKNFLLGDILLFQKVIGTNEFNFTTAFAQYCNDFPESPYIALLRSLTLTAANAKTTKPGANISIDTATTYNTFNDIKRHFKGKSVYIDLWATWCVPCRAEFPYYPGLQPKLKQKSITSVFVSIDIPIMKTQWVNLVTQNHLDGYHILAGKSLQSDIKKIVYQQGQVSIPRYIILNKDGRVVSWDAPRPSNPALGKLLDKL
ncbi:TlpA family protein disulfide reductase [Mucilaginibacter ginsenosidivorax]|uniref:TlpA family protein disulfide reductase n=1 Tax=Mucilaginibacter ginsenosidivorax TaxID=862126 RepID=UPI0013152187|nr:TlpA disulfide reductase family protein [Mucilaginibacter ginsenosidivorax]